MDDSTFQSADAKLAGECELPIAPRDGDCQGVEASDLPVLVDPLEGSTSISLYCRCPMLVALLAVVAGILVDYLWAPPEAVSLAVAVVSLLAWCGRRFGAELTASPRAVIPMVMLLIGVAAIGAAWHHIYWHRFSVDDIGLAASLDSTPCCVELRLGSEPQFAPEESRYLQVGDDELKTYFSARAIRIRDGETWQSVAGKAQLVVHALSLIHI